MMYLFRMVIFLSCASLPEGSWKFFFVGTGFEPLSMIRDPLRLQESLSHLGAQLKLTDPQNWMQESPTWIGSASYFNFDQQSTRDDQRIRDAQQSIY